MATLTRDERTALEALRIPEDSIFDPDAYTSYMMLRTITTFATMQRLAALGLCEGDGLGYRLTKAGRKALRYGKYPALVLSEKQRAALVLASDGLPYYRWTLVPNSRNQAAEAVVAALVRRGFLAKRQDYEQYSVNVYEITSMGRVALELTSKAAERWERDPRGRK